MDRSGEASAVGNWRGFRTRAGATRIAWECFRFWHNPESAESSV